MESTEEYEFLEDDVLLRNIPDTALLASLPENVLNTTYNYIDALQEPQNSGLIYSSSPATGALPSIVKHLGDHNFITFISPEANGPDYQYSTELNKIFVNIDKSIPILFHTSSHRPGLYVRAVAVYVSCTDLHIPVTRCANHTDQDKTANKDITLIEHVVRCVSPNATYYKDTESGRLSVRVKYDPPHAGVEHVKICYKFTCLSSCKTRRKMGIIFTLEDENEEVLGRQFMNIRICSCPRRDKEKEESGESKIPNQKRAKKTSTLCENEPPAKFCKTEDEDIPLVSIPVKFSHLKELAKFASDLIYRDVGREQRPISNKEKQMLEKYRQITETREENLHHLVSSELDFNPDP